MDRHAVQGSPDTHTSHYTTTVYFLTLKKGAGRQYNLKKALLKWFPEENERKIDITSFSGDEYVITNSNAQTAEIRFNNGLTTTAYIYPAGTVLNTLENIRMFQRMSSGVTPEMAANHRRNIDDANNQRLAHRAPHVDLSHDSSVTEAPSSSSLYQRSASQPDQRPSSASQPAQKRPGDDTISIQGGNRRARIDTNVVDLVENPRMHSNQIPETYMDFSTLVDNYVRSLGDDDANTPHLAYYMIDSWKRREEQGIHPSFARVYARIASSTQDDIKRHVRTVTVFTTGANDNSMRIYANKFLQLIKLNPAERPGVVCDIETLGVFLKNITVALKAVSCNDQLIKIFKKIVDPNDS